MRPLAWLSFLLLCACGGPSHAAPAQPAASPASATVTAAPGDAGAATARAPAQSDPAYKRDIQRICDAPQWLASVGLDQSKLDPSQKARVMAEHVVEGLETEAGRAFWKRTIASESTTPETRGNRFIAEATAQGITPCAFGQWFLAPY